jgi:multiple sugar transport system ATP-binding protein
MAAIQLDHLRHSYVSGVEVISGFSLAIEDGSFCTLVGPSGSGKTTILRLIAGLERPAAGKIFLNSREVQSVPPARRGVAMVFQRPAIYPHLSVAENLAFSSRLEQSFLQWLGSIFRESAREAAVERRVKEVAGLLDLSEILDRSPGSLSGGQQQRLALGRALARNPGVLLLDEPFSQLDAGLRSELRHELRLLQRKLGATVIYVTHDQEEAMSLSDQLAVIDKGVLQQAGSPGQVYSRPHNRFVGGFVGSPTMHFVDGHLCTNSGKMIWRSALGDLRAPPAWQGFSRATPVELSIGFRAEDLSLESDSSEASPIPMKVVLVERLGYANLVTLEREGLQTVARVPAQIAPEPGEVVPVALRLEKAHLFDSTGMALKFAESTA